MANTLIIRLYCTDNVASNMGTSVLDKAKDYVDHVFIDGDVRAKTNNTKQPPYSVDNKSDLLHWWEGEPETSNTDANLLIYDATAYGEGGKSNKDQGSSGVAGIHDGFDNMDGPYTDSDFIGGQPVTGYAAPMQAATILHEIMHMYGGANHTHGYAREDGNQSINYTSPMLTGYGEQTGGGEKHDTNNCSWDSTYNSFYETRYVEGFTTCAGTYDDFPGSIRTYTKLDIDNF